MSRFSPQVTPWAPDPTAAAQGIASAFDQYRQAQRQDLNDRITQQAAGVHQGAPPGMDAHGPSLVGRIRNVFAAITGHGGPPPVTGATPGIGMTPSAPSAPYAPTPVAIDGQAPTPSAAPAATPAPAMLAPAVPSYGGGVPGAFNPHTQSFGGAMPGAGLPSTSAPAAPAPSAPAPVPAPPDARTMTDTVTSAYLGDRPRYERLDGNHYVDQLDNPQMRELRMNIAQTQAMREYQQGLNQNAHASLVQTFGADKVGPYAPGMDYTKMHHDLLDSADKGRTLGEETRHHQADETNTGNANAETRSYHGAEIGVRRQEAGTSAARAANEARYQQGVLDNMSTRLREIAQHHRAIEGSGGGGGAGMVKQDAIAARQAQGGYDRMLKGRPQLNSAAFTNKATLKPDTAGYRQALTNWRADSTAKAGALGNANAQLAASRAGLVAASGDDGADDTPDMPTPAAAAPAPASGPALGAAGGVTADLAAAAAALRAAGGPSNPQANARYQALVARMIAAHGGRL